ncbi:DUF3857 domain-containing protein [Aestuariibaculum sediminum]|uniref:DUF3857 domain-containing transglutaminase family protein n=1 Tax=Aestuariibaculum sediminum TaxID=2770637 RepID=A0A8J6U855_9FLAO|nr:DUF3857 domain-containing protein [Aestuariibaculum sediminum]MBD0832875.1 DUF3857 domain-containing transglutaminase family protein [Aestuariibaculum sediminum]
MKLSAIILFLSVSLFGFSQDYKFGKVSKEELKEQICNIDSTANAAFLYKNRHTHVEYEENQGFFYVVTDIHERIKIYNKEGFDYATKIIDLNVSGSDEESIQGLKAYTYNLDNGKVEDVKLEKDGIFETEKHKYLKQLSFTMPNIKEGCVIEYKYTVMSPFYWRVDDFYFQHDIPVKKVEARFDTPEYFNFKMVSKGYLPLAPDISRKSDRFTFNNKVRTSSNYNSTTTFESNTIDYMRIYNNYNFKNVPALRDESHVNNINNYRSAVLYELSYTKFPQAPIKYYATTWEDVVKTIYDSPSFGDELKKNNFYKDDIDALLAGVTQPEAKSAKIFQYVKSRMRWNKFIGKYTQEGLKKAYAKQEGNVADINLMLVSMLRYAGLQANPVLLSTRDNGVPMFPTLNGYNYVIAAIEIQDGLVLLDATSPNGLPNVLPIRALNWVGRLVRENKSSTTVDLYTKQKSKSNVSLLADLSSTGELNGNIRFMRSNYLAMDYRNHYFESDQETYLESLSNRFKNIEISDFKVTNAKNISKPVSETFKFTLESQADIINDKIFFSPLFFLKQKENPFKLEKREFPVDFSYPTSKQYKLAIKIPEGYKIESLPESVHLLLPENLGSFKFIVQTSGDGKIIHIVLDNVMNESIISPLYYADLKAYFSKLIEKQSEQIVLTKV